MDELFYYTGFNAKSLAQFLRLKEDEYKVTLNTKDQCFFTFEDITITPNSLVYYNETEDMYDFFILDS